ncbi:MAG TPA: hypothetical protein VFL59_02120 [Candidatus Nanopelagicales bacterium]|nr:hypothetical protein [Candidatus Nanopelagicales bacterium]
MDDLVRAVFPDALTADRFCDAVDTAARGTGFEPGATLLVTGSCRDELCFPFGDRLQRTWGSAFHVGSLGGLLFLGRTGLSAAHAHAPRGHRRRRYLVVALTHVGIGTDGTLGRVARPHQEQESSACGALVALQQEIVSGAELAELDPDDLEQGLLRRRLAFLWSRGADLTVLDVTLAARDAIRQDIERLHPALDPDGRSDVLLVTGVLVHAADGDRVAAYDVTRIHPDGRGEPVALGR